MRRQGEEGVMRLFAGGSPEWSWEVVQVDLLRVSSSFIYNTLTLFSPNPNFSPSGYPEPHRWPHSEAMAQGFCAGQGRSLVNGVSAT